MGKGCINYNFSLVRLFRYSRRAQVRIWFNLSVALKLKVCCICGSTMIIIFLQEKHIRSVHAWGNLNSHHFPSEKETHWGLIEEIQSTDFLNDLVLHFPFEGVGLHTKPLLRVAVGQTTLNPYEWGGALRNKTTTASTIITTNNKKSTLLSAQCRKVSVEWSQNWFEHIKILG